MFAETASCFASKSFLETRQAVIGCTLAAQSSEPLLSETFRNEERRRNYLRRLRKELVELGGIEPPTLRLPAFLSLRNDAYLRLLPCKHLHRAAQGCTEYGPTALYGPNRKAPRQGPPTPS